MIFLQLFWSFLKIGFTSFGGLSMIPLISSEMIGHRWLTVNEISDIVAIAEMTPGPLGLNCATYAGMKTAGILGAIAANLGVLTPTFTFGVAVAIFFEKFKDNRMMQKIMIGIRPACVGLLVGVILTMSATNYVSTEQEIQWFYVGLGIFDLLLLLKFKMSIPIVITFSALVGIVASFIW